MGMLLRMPAEVQALRDPWPSLVGTIPHLTRDLEKRFRFGQRVSATSKGYFLGGAIKGGSSSVWVPTGPEVFDAYRGWRAREGFQARRPNGSLSRLSCLLGPSGIRLFDAKAEPIGAEEAPLAEVYELCFAILSNLPGSHLRRDSLQTIQLGGWGPDSAKGSAYQNSKVAIYDFAMRGARRTFIGLFLHELGHAHEAVFSRGVRARLEAQYRVLAETNAFVGVEFLLDAASRRTYQRLAFSEFLAELYMVYAVCGARLRSHVEEQTGAAAEAWRSVYATFRASFDDVEYA